MNININMNMCTLNHYVWKLHNINKRTEGTRFKTPPTTDTHISVILRYIAFLFLTVNLQIDL